VAVKLFQTPRRDVNAGVKRWPHSTFRCPLACGALYNTWTCYSEIVELLVSEEITGFTHVPSHAQLILGNMRCERDGRRGRVSTRTLRTCGDDRKNTGT